jgi:hypothetical protein
MPQGDTSRYSDNQDRLASTETGAATRKRDAEQGRPS